jgi:hypothetical protein
MAVDDLEELDTVLSNSSTQDDVDQGGDGDASIEGEKCPLHNQSPCLHIILTANGLTDNPTGLCRSLSGLLRVDRPVDFLGLDRCINAARNYYEQLM